MRIKQLHIEGYRSLKNVTWEPSNLNVLIGANGTGKSNLLRFLNLLSSAAQGTLGKDIQMSGGMGALVWDGRAPTISFGLKTDAPDVWRDPEYYKLQLARLGTGSAYRVNQELLANYASVRDDVRQQPFKLLERDMHHAVVFDEEERGLVAPPESIPEEETLLSAASGPFINNRRIPAFQQQLSAITVYHDVNVSRESAMRQPTIARTEHRVAADGGNLNSVLHTLYTTDRNFEHDIDAAMRAAFGDDYEKLIFPPAADQRIQLRVRWKTLKREQSAADLSDGTLRFLFLLTVLATPDPPTVIAIDEPEIGLHPAMLPIVAEYAVDAALRAQVVISTHSSQLLDSFTEVRPKTTVMKWQDGQTILQNFSGEELDYWLQEYTLGTLHKSRELENLT